MIASGKFLEYQFHEGKSNDLGRIKTGQTTGDGMKCQKGGSLGLEYLLLEQG